MSELLSCESFGAILSHEFRANPNYELVLFDHLAPEAQGMLGDLRQDPDFYGVLRPREGIGVGLGVKSVSRDAALLLFTLQQPGPIPAYVRELYGDVSNQAITELVLDGVLEIAWAGRFVSGPEAATLIDSPNQTHDPAYLEIGHDCITALSLAALRYAQNMEISDSLTLSARLYFYNRMPASPRWRDAFPSPMKVMTHLGIQRGGRNERLIKAKWSRMSEQGMDGWLTWRRREPVKAGPRSTLTYKLYVSPECEQIASAFDAVLDVLSTSNANQFKVGADVYGLLRPDKLVIYFAQEDTLRETAAALAARLNGMPAQGVPFSAELAGEGLLSWGVDPPREEQVLRWQERQSWRLWVTNRLATYLLLARSNPVACQEPWQFALQRIRLEGVDVTQWMPTSQWKPALQQASTEVHV